MKRCFDVLASAFGLLLVSPVLLTFMFMIWWQDKHSPFYIAERVGQGGRLFRMIKLRSMVVNAAGTGVESTPSDDARITRVGRLVRNWKIDELSQLINVLKGDMSLVGPRPNVKADVDLYTDEEMRLLSVRPGITDFSSIVFSDEGEILEGAENPDLKYNQIIRPWKSRLGLLYVNNTTLGLDIILLVTTLLGILKKEHALILIGKLLKRYDADSDLIKIASRSGELYQYPPPGSDTIVQERPLVS